MKTTLKLAAAFAVASTLLASQAFAGDWQGQQRMSERNAEYFQGSGTKIASNWEPTTASYDTSNPKQRMGQRNADYFAEKTSADAEAQPMKAKTSHPKKH